MKNTLCNAPTKGLHRNTMGYFSPCCIFNGKKLYSSLEDYKQSDELLNVKKSLDAGIYPSECSVCERDSEIGRTVYAKSYAANSIRIDIRDRSCNLECLSCGDFASTAHGSKTKKIFVDNSQNLIEIYKYIEENKNFIKDVYFAGGEPFMMKLTYKILSMLNEDTRISFSTNCTFKTYKGVGIKEHLHKFKNISLMPSCDGINEIAEFTRKNLNFTDFMTTLDYYRTFTNIESVYNVLSVPVILTYNETYEFWHKYGLRTEFHIMEGTTTSRPINPIHYDNKLFTDIEYPHKNYIELLNKQIIDHKIDINFWMSVPSRISNNMKNYILK